MFRWEKFGFDSNFFLKISSIPPKMVWFRFRLTTRLVYVDQKKNGFDRRCVRFQSSLLLPTSYYREKHGSLKIFSVRTYSLTLIKIVKVITNFQINTPGGDKLTSKNTSFVHLNVKKSLTQIRPSISDLARYTFVYRYNIYTTYGLLNQRNNNTNIAGKTTQTSKRPVRDMRWAKLLLADENWFLLSFDRRIKRWRQISFENITAFPL